MLLHARLSSGIRSDGARSGLRSRAASRRPWCPRHHKKDSACDSSVRPSLGAGLILIDRKSLGDIGDLMTHAFQRALILEVHEHVADPAKEVTRLRLLESARGDR